MSVKRNCRLCSRILVCSSRPTDPPSSVTDQNTGNLFTPWFKLIARDFLFGWWDELLARRAAGGNVDAKTLSGIVDGSKVVKMV